MSTHPVAPEPALGTRANHILALLRDADIERLRPELEPITAERGALAYRPGDRIDHVYFPLTAMGSTTASSSEGMTVEVLSIGREGTTGLPIHMGSETAPLEVIWQVPGAAIQMRSDVFAAELDRHAGLFDVMQRYGQFATLAMAQTILCSRVHQIDSRAARWLLQSQDAVGADTFALTHEFFATMLGVHRPSISLAANSLQGANAIRYRRGIVTILDREYLMEVACECYDVIADEYRRLLSAPSRL